jgi:ubiquinone/menaquinone biosynthesis C-methylase UbiE
MTEAGAQVIGIDPNPKRIVRARESAQNSATFVEGSAEALPCDDDSMDIVVLFNSLHHVPVPAMDKALTEAARVLKPGAVLYVSEPIAAGAHFEAMRPISDETQVRAEALAAVNRAVESGLFRQESEEINRTTRYEDSFETYCQRMIDANPARESMVLAKKEDIRARFESSAHKTPDGYEIDRQTRFNLLRKT